MSRGTRYQVVPKVGFPRVSGDEPSLISKTAFLPLFSPRERG